MKINISKQIENSFEFLVEREIGQYNNCSLISELSESEVQELSEDEIKTLAWLRVKPTAIRVFNEIEPLNEVDTPAEFKIVPSIPKRIEIIGNSTIMVGSTAEYQAAVYDQYGQVISDVDLTWNNKTVTAIEVGVMTVTASLGNMSESFTVSAIEKPKSREEQLQELVDQLIIDKLNMQRQIDTLVTSSLEV